MTDGTVRTLGQRVTAVNSLLAAVYGRDVRLISLFTELGASADEIEHLRSKHIGDSCNQVTTAVAACFASFRNGDRDYQILSRRVGLDGHLSTLEEIGEELGVTRERVRQLEVRARRKCRLQKNRLAIEKTLQNLLQTVRSSWQGNSGSNNCIEQRASNL